MQISSSNACYGKYRSDNVTTFYVAANGGSEAADYDVRRYFGGGKGVALVIRQAWRGRGGK